MLAENLNQQGVGLHVLIPSLTIMFQQLLSTSATKWAVGGWSFFIAENVILSENRTFFISEFGEDNYRLAYGSCSTAAMASIVYGYFYKIKNQAPFRQIVPRSAMLGGFMISGLGAVMASQMFPKLQIPVHMESSSMSSQSNNTDSMPSAIESTPSPQKSEWKVRCPFDFTDQHNQDTADSKSSEKKDVNVVPKGYQPRGIERITRHPSLWAFGLMGLGSAVLTPSAPQALWLSMPMLVAWIGGAHQDSRHARGIGGGDTTESDDASASALPVVSLKTQQKLERTSHIPFWALLTGKQEDESWTRLMEEFKGLNAALALGTVGIWALRRGRGIGSSSFNSGGVVFNRVGVSKSTVSGRVGTI